MRPQNRPLTRPKHPIENQKYVRFCRPSPVRVKVLPPDHLTETSVGDMAGTSPLIESDAIAPAAGPRQAQCSTPPTSVVEPSKTPVEPPNPPHRESELCSVFAPSSLRRRLPPTRLPTGGDPHWENSSRLVGTGGSSCVPTVRQLSLRRRWRYGARRSRGCGILRSINGMAGSVKDQMEFPTMTNRVPMSSIRA